MTCYARDPFIMGQIVTVEVNGYGWPVERVLINSQRGWRILGSDEPEDAWLASLDIVERRIQRRIQEGKMHTAAAEPVNPAQPVRRPLCDRCGEAPPIARGPDGKGLWCAACLPDDLVPGPRGREVLALLQERRSIQEVADQMGVGQATVYRELTRLKGAGIDRVKAPTPGRPPDLERRAAVEALLLEEKATAEIEEATGVPKTVIDRIRRELRLAQDPTSDPPQMAQVIRLRMECLTLQQIAQRLGLSKSAVHRMTTTAERRGVVFPGASPKTTLANLARKEEKMKTPRTAKAPVAYSPEVTELINAAAFTLNLKSDDPQLLAPMIRDLRKASERIEREARRQAEEAERLRLAAEAEVEGLRVAVEAANAQLEEERVAVGKRMGELEQALKEARTKAGGAEVERRLRAELKDALEGAEEAVLALKGARADREAAEVRRVQAAQDAAARREEVNALRLQMESQAAEYDAMIEGTRRELEEAKATIRRGLEREGELLARVQRLQGEASARLHGDLHRAAGAEDAFDVAASACVDLARRYIQTDYPASSLFGPAVTLERRADEAIRAPLRDDPDAINRAAAALLALVMVHAGRCEEGAP